MTQTELINLAKPYNWQQSLCDLYKGQVVLRAQNSGLAVYYRVRPGQGCRHIFKRNRLKMRSLTHEVSFAYLRQGAKPHVIGPFGDRFSGILGFNLITCRFQPWENRKRAAAQSK